MIKHQKLITLGLLMVFLFTFSFFVQKRAEAKFISGFGGRVTMKQACTCSGGNQVTIQGPGQSTGTYLELPTTRLFKYNFISQGRNVTGVFTPGGQCTYLDPKTQTCMPRVITKGTINFAGVSF